VLSTIQRVATKDLPEAWDWIDVPLEMEMEIGEVDGPWDEMTDYEGE
jgi:hypothetical protein